MVNCGVVIVNPLPETLAHYVRELRDDLLLCGIGDVDIIDVASVEHVRGTADRVRRTWQALRDRSRMDAVVGDRTAIVVWPAFGYLDPLTYRKMSRSRRILLVVHDPIPLRPSYGYSRAARVLFRHAVRKYSVEVVYHTDDAQRAGKTFTGVTGGVAPHPISAEPVSSRRTRNQRRASVRVLGQYKPTRSAHALESIAATCPDLSLEIYGRGWTPIDRWNVRNEFIPDAEFDELLTTADCVVLPYDSFFQSGVAIRCLEAKVRLVAPAHPQIIDLYGGDWPGIVGEDGDWGAAVLRTLATQDFVLTDRYAAALDSAVKGWGRMIGMQPAVNVQNQDRAFGIAR